LVNGGGLKQDVSPSYGLAIDNKIASIRGSIAMDGLRYTDYALEFEVGGVWAESNTATVIWSERVVLDLAGDPDPMAPQISFEMKTHLTSLRKDGGKWYVEADDDQFGLQPMVWDPTGASPPITDSPASTDRILRS
jgi:hypothetical protein